jgi:sigma-B regulation protein RsbU (phosphoserine phosphatase)
MRVLIAEDDRISMHLLTTNLQRWGHEPVRATDGLEALKLLQGTDAPRLAILDWMLPDMEGPEICKRLHEQSASPPYVILLTARQGLAEEIKGMKAGADDYLTKPYNREELQIRIEVGVRMIELQKKLADRIEELEAALEQVKHLQGIIPICGYCKHIRDDKDYWQNVESYLAVHSDIEFSHGICPACYDSVVKPQLEAFNIERMELATDLHG